MQEVGLTLSAKWRVPNPFALAASRPVLDLGAEPFLPEGWKVAEHRKCGERSLDVVSPVLYFSPNQQDDRLCEGMKLRKELARKSVMNANVLDCFLARPELIREIWHWKKFEGVFFWGTIFVSLSGRLCVRCLCHSREVGWYSGHSLLWDDWSKAHPAVCWA
jgi:hypothetical protein